MRKNLILLAISVTLALALVEGALRWALPGEARSEPPLLLMSHVQSRDELGAVRFEPHRDIRSVLIYGTHIEADTRFPSNDLGLVDYRDYLPADKAGRRIAFVGDSYATGLEGTRPWIPALRDRLGMTAYALGMGGTGVLGFERMLRSVARHLEFSEIVFVALTDDFFRPLWRPLVRDTRVWLCPDGMEDHACMTRWPPAIHLIKSDSAAAELLADATKIRASLARKPGVVGTLVQNVRLLQLARDVVSRLLRQSSRRAILGESLAALGRIRQAYPSMRIRFVHVPDRHETGRGAYDADIASMLAPAGIEYLPVLGKCPWTTRQFLPNDNHPNSDGYAALGRCVERLLALETPPGR